MKTRFLKRPLSHSQLAAWEYDSSDWYTKYILGGSYEPTPAMLFGSMIGDLLGTPDSPIPELAKQGVKEVELRGEIEGIPLVGYLDGWEDDALTLHENKTSDNPNKWTQRKANSHKQIDMYLLLLLQQKGIPPESVTSYLHFVQSRPTGLGYRLHKTPKWHSFAIRPKTMDDLDAYQEYVMATVEKMHEYILMREREDRLSTPVPKAPAFRGIV